VITGRNSRAVEMRAAELNIGTVIQGAADKLAAYRQLLHDLKLQPEQVCTMGDDLPDVPLLRNCGFAVAVADACVEANADAHYVTRVPGGQGAVREAVELILGCQRQWQSVVERLRKQSLSDS